MSSTTVQSLSQATTSTFEELALLFPELELLPEQAAAPLDVAVSVDFRGPLAGRLVVRASQCILPTIAANMLGADGSKQPSLQRDALGEVANVICGHVVPLIVGTDAVVNLSAPRVHEPGGLTARDADEPAARVEFGVDSGRVETRLYLFPAAAAAA